MKTLEVYPEMTLNQLRHHFTKTFPHLELDLVTDHSKSDKTLDGQTMDELAGAITHCCFLIEGNMFIADLESDFQECYGLAVRIKRWTGYAWHDTDDTRDWTLEQQNQKGAQVSGKVVLVSFDKITPA
ncbi:MAG: hypothetical protein LH609_21860 [Rudanella sp.]|nr:hypothetical protein [Rudanella sp.]